MDTAVVPCCVSEASLLTLFCEFAAIVAGVTVDLLQRRSSS